MNKGEYRILYNKKTTIIVSWMVVLVWMAIIFNLSSQPAYKSDGLSKGVAEIVIETTQKVVPKAEFDMDRFNHLLRKNAHFFAYLLLGILTLTALRKSGVQGLGALALALGICVLYAISDEVHQLYVPGRGGQVRDVLLDSAGAVLGLGLYWTINKLVLIKR